MLTTFVSRVRWGRQEAGGRQRREASRHELTRQERQDLKLPLVHAIGNLWNSSHKPVGQASQPAVVDPHP